METSIEEELFEILVEDPDASGGLGEKEQAAEPGNFLRHAGALSLSKMADGLIDPKLVLSWLVTHLGAGAGIAGLLVPVREAGALLPQLFTAARIHAMARRKWAWAAGAAGQGIAAGGIALAGLTLEGAAAGWVIVALLGLLALSRSVCSVAFKDVLGKTVGKTRRGTVTGAASSVSAAAVLVFAGVLIAGWGDRYAIVIGAVALAAGFWLLAGAIFATLTEIASDTEPPKNTLGEALGQLSLLRDRPQLVRFITARSLLVGTALAPPYLVVLAQEAGESGLSNLGVLVLASSGASLLSSFVWGRMADRSSRRVLMLAGVASALALLAALAARALGLAGTVWAVPVVLFGLMIAYHGVRNGRSTYLVDMAPEDERAAYTAVSNTVVGVVLLVAGGLSAAVASVGVGWVIALYAALSVVGAVVAYGLKEVE
ncbi:MFS transporter [Aestuariibius sp. 2305UL40-4]|uniref:MFS transporter n=1 Tax=Aestuariibius violaceus TaxID=3234132 RepID=UPI00345E8D79